MAMPRNEIFLHHNKLIWFRSKFAAKTHRQPAAERLAATYRVGKFSDGVMSSTIKHVPHRDGRSAMRVPRGHGQTALRRAALAGLLAATCLPCGAHAGKPDHALKLKRAQAKIEHIIIIMQENRSFDSYFGTFPGAHGIQDGACVPLNPAKPDEGCVVPYHDPHDINAAGPHHSGDAQNDMDDGITTAKMDGYVKVQTSSHNGNTGCETTTDSAVCIAVYQGVARHDVAGYHTDTEIANYWAYARNFLLQDQLYEGVRSWSYPSHLDLTSEWSAICSDPQNALSCVSSPAPTPPTAKRAISLPWANLFQLLDLHGVSWKYYVGTGAEPDCENGDMACTPGHQAPGVGSEWNPTAFFGSVQAAGSAYIAQHNPDTAQFYADIALGTLPQVSWLIPAGGNAEHPPDRVTKGMEYVTALVNAVMASQYWSNTAIFITWDDWGGFYDHATPPNVDTNSTTTPVQGFGLRIPGLLVSAYAKPGAIDSSVLNFASYASFIEDLFMDSARLDPASLGVPDNRPTIRDALTSVVFPDGTIAPVGDLLDEFDFSQTPIAPLILSTAIPTDLAANCGATPTNGFLCTTQTVTVHWSALGAATGVPPYIYHVTRDGADLPACIFSQHKACLDQPGPGNHLYRIYTVDGAGTASPKSAAVEADMP
jgi:phospholipase C